MLKGLVLSLSEQPETFHYVKNAAAQSMPGQEAVLSALMRNGQETHTRFFQTRTFLFSLKRNESWKYSSSIILGGCGSLHGSLEYHWETIPQSVNGSKTQQSICQAGSWYRQQSPCLRQDLIGSSVLLTYKPTFRIVMLGTITHINSLKLLCTKNVAVGVEHVKETCPSLKLVH